MTVRNCFCQVPTICDDQMKQQLRKLRDPSIAVDDAIFAMHSEMATQYEMEEDSSASLLLINHERYLQAPERSNDSNNRLNNGLTLLNPTDSINKSKVPRAAYSLSENPGIQRNGMTALARALDEAPFLCKFINDLENALCFMTKELAVNDPSDEWTGGDGNEDADYEDLMEVSPDYDYEMDHVLLRQENLPGVACS
ncbi:hypothetical protein BGX27_009280 [Mortierella sp. AM989]|nr:hypothetical protein BGX27_009280 [Mortierella sp. AM989]